MDKPMPDRFARAGPREAAAAREEGASRVLAIAEKPREQGSTEPSFFAFAAAILERFPGARVSWLRLASVPKYELGGELQQWMRENSDRVETYERGMWGFGRLPDDGPKPTPWVPQDTQRRSPKIGNDQVTNT